MTEKPILITIDGPAGAGKTTVSRSLARRLDILYVDTGALYRGVALAVQREGTPIGDDEALQRLLEKISLDFARTRRGLRLMLNGRDVTDSIRTPEISLLASDVSARPAVRAFLLGVQRELAKNRSAVFEGRDMGTVVFPDADVKFFLHADLGTRAARRHRELGESGGSLERVTREMARRDENDSSRDLAPLKPAQDAIPIDSTDLTPGQVVERMLEAVRAAERKKIY